MSVSEKTRSVPSRPMALPPSVSLGYQPDQRRHDESGNRRHAPGLGRRQRAGAEQTQADHGDGDEEKESPESHEPRNGSLSECRMRSRKQQGTEAADAVTPSNSGPHLMRLSDMRLDPS